MSRHDAKAPKRTRNFRTADAEWEAWKQAAEADGRSLSNWMRHRLNLAAAEREGA
ncbi:MAG: hypothetical protein OXG06_00285 [Gammaproteobacteria bacterium]|nr:hypothetical protein [Gammaproteobacteria bacterium]